MQDNNIVGYFYPDGIIKYDKSSTQIERIINKETLLRKEHVSR